MKFCTFASGSSGNCAFVSHGNTSLLIDSGISMRRILNNLKSRGFAFSDISGILITHSHSDHISALKMLSKHHGIPIYAPVQTADIICRTFPETLPYILPFEPNISFEIGEISVSSFRTPHDSFDSVGYRLSAGGKTLSFVTDLGHITRSIVDAITGSDAAILESNHDIDMLKNGKYPHYLKQRIINGSGHLSNEQCGKLAAYLVSSGTKRIVLAHLSKENNIPSLAYQTVCSCIENSETCSGCQAEICVAPANDMGDFYIV